MKFIVYIYVTDNLCNTAVNKVGIQNVNSWSEQEQDISSSIFRARQSKIKAFFAISKYFLGLLGPFDEK